MVVEESDSQCMEHKRYGVGGVVSKVLWAGVTFERGGKNWFLLSAGRGLALTRLTRDIPSDVIRPRSELSSCALTSGVYLWPEAQELSLHLAFRLGR